MNMRCLWVMVAVLLLSPSVYADGHAKGCSGEDSVWRMVYYKIKPGQEQRFWGEAENVFLPVSKVSLREGVVCSFKWFKNPYPGSERDWDAMLILEYDNYAELDSMPERAAKAYLEVFGSQDAVDAEGAQRPDYRDVLRVDLVEEVYLK